MSSNIEVVTVDATNLAKRGFFCCKSKKKSEGYQRKLRWLEERFGEGVIRCTQRSAVRHQGT